jgi:glycosyltransferase involved in cell wall biosynthesis
MFSVVIPLYNKAHTIVNTIQTVLNQTYTDFEIVVVNDGSTDNGVEVIQQHFSDSRIRIVNQQNQGVSAARNNGVASSKYELIAFLDGDDEMLPEYLSKMKEAIDLYPEAGMYCCAGFLRYPNGDEYSRTAKRFGNSIQEINYFENPYFFSHSSSTIVRKSEFNKTDGFPVGMKINEDLVFFCSFSFVVKSIYCPFPLTVYLKEVEGHASASNPKIHEFVIGRTNQVYQNWLKSGKQNKLFLVFTRYEMRNEMLTYLKLKDYYKVDYFINHLDRSLLNYFPSLELHAYKTKWLRIPAIIYIYFTKLIWKSGGYPVVQYKKISNKS